MTFIIRGLAAALVVPALLTTTSCSHIEPAGSLGQLLQGETNLRPTPVNYLHVPPRDQDRNPTPMQWAMTF